MFVIATSNFLRKTDIIQYSSQISSRLGETAPTVAIKHTLISFLIRFHKTYSNKYSVKSAP